MSEEKNPRCGEALCQGWAIFNEDHVERCDVCRILDDEQAIKIARAVGLYVHCDGTISWPDRGIMAQTCLLCGDYQRMSDTVCDACLDENPIPDRMPCSCSLCKKRWAFTACNRCYDCACGQCERHEDVAKK